MSQVNLLPPEILQRQRYRRLSLLVMLAAGVALFFVLAFYLLQVSNLSSVRSDISDQEDTNAQIQTEIDGLQEFAALRADAEAKQALLLQVYAGEVSFSGVLMDLSNVIPSDSYLQDLSVQVTSTAPVVDGTVVPAADAVTTGLIGQITATGRAANIDAVATFITRMESVAGWENPWVSTLSVEEDGIVSFSMGADLSAEVLTPRGAGEATGEGA